MRRVGAWWGVGVGAAAAAVGSVLLGWAALAGGSAPAVAVEEVPVTALDLRTPTAQTSPAVAVDPTNEAFAAAAVRRDMPGPGCTLLVSGDGGDSWVPVEAVGTLPDGVEGCHAPDVGFDSDGRLVFSFVGVTPESPPQPDGLFAVTSQDNAQTFTQPRRVAEIATFATESAVAGDGTMTAVWARAAGDAKPGGAGWPVGEAVMVATGDHSELGRPRAVAEPEGLVAAPTIAVDGTGRVTVAYYELPAAAAAEGGLAALIGAGQWRLMAAHRPADADGFGEPVEVAEVRLPGEPDTDNNPLAVLAPRLVSQRGIATPGVAAAAGRVCLAWTHQPEVGALDALASCSPAARGGWRTPVRLGTEVGDGWGQWLPQLAATDADELEAVFYTGPLAGEQVGGADVYHTTGDPADGFGEPRRLSTRSSHAQVAPNRGWYGTRLGLAARGQQTVAMWADSRNSMAIHPGQTIFAATVARAGEGEGLVPAWLAAAVAAAGLVVAVGGVWRRRASGAPPGEGVGEADPAGVAR